jgi:hypothetical protein
MLRRLVWALVLLGAAVAFAGCTAIGYFVGAHSDKKKPLEAKPLARSDVQVLEAGEAVEVHLWDGRVLSGRYQGLEWAPRVTYGPRYEAARKTLAAEVALPALGPGARLTVTSGISETGDFRGVGPGFVRFTPARQPEISIGMERVVTLSDAEGRSITGEALGRLVAERRLPAITSLVIETPVGNERVDHAEVAGLSRLVRSHRGRVTGTLIGLAVDVAVVAWLSYELSGIGEGWNDTSADYTSCPLIDSFDGEKWVLDAEPLGGTIYRAAKRTDLAPLAHLAATDGHYRVRVRNDQAEIDHLDALALRVVDHAAGDEVVPDGSARLHTVHTTVAPEEGRAILSSARERRGGGIAELVSTADGEAWVSDWWGHDPSVPEELRDGIELVYPHPAGAESALLVTRAGGTALAPRVMRDALALHGRDLGRFYARLNEDVAVQKMFARAWAREAMPTVRVFDGRDWRLAGYIRDLPSLVHRDQALALDLRGIEGPSLRLRIDGPPGMWTIDRAVVSFDAERTVDAEPTTLEEATDPDGRDVSDLVRRVDGRLHSLRPHLDTVTLAFAAPPPRPGRARTVLVEANGYYSVIVRSEGAPQSEAFRRLVEEPGAVARFALERLRERSQVATDAR